MLLKLHDGKKLNKTQPEVSTFNFYEPYIILRDKKVKVKSLSRVRLSVTPGTVAYQAPPTMGFSRQEYWSGLLFPSSGDLPNPGIKPWSPALEADALTSERQEGPFKSKVQVCKKQSIKFML